MGILSAFSPINNTEKKKDQIPEEAGKVSLDDEDKKWNKENIMGSPMIVSSSVPSSAQRKVFGSSATKISNSGRTMSSIKVNENLTVETVANKVKETPQSKI